MCMSMVASMPFCLCAFVGFHFWSISWSWTWSHAVLNPRVFVKTQNLNPLAVYCSIGNWPITTFRCVGQNCVVLSKWGGYYQLCHRWLLSWPTLPCILFIFAPIVTQTSTIICSFISTPKIMIFFAWWSQRCLLFNHDF